MPNSVSDPSPPDPAAAEAVTVDVPSPLETRAERERGGGRLADAVRRDGHGRTETAPVNPGGTWYLETGVTVSGLDVFEPMR